MTKWKRSLAVLTAGIMAVTAAGAAMADPMSEEQRRQAIEAEAEEGDGEIPVFDGQLSAVYYGASQTESTVKTYSVKEDGDMYLSPHFQVKEFQSHDWADEVLIDSRLVEYLEQIRVHFGKAVNVNSGYRTVAHNAKVGGAKNSYHTRGMAADIAIKNVAPVEVARYAESIGMNGVGLYGTFVHVDTRSYKYYWNNEGDPYEVESFAQRTKPGDADGDGDVTVQDSLQVLRYIVGTAADIVPELADVDGNGEIDVTDALGILKMIAGSW